MRITAERRRAGSLLKEWTSHRLSRGLVIKLNVPDAHFLLSVVAETPF